MGTFTGCVFGVIIWFLVRYLVAGFFTVGQNERAVKTVFGRAQRIEGQDTLSSPLADCMRPEEKERYNYPQVRVIGPGGPYFKWPWEQIHKVSIATQTVNMARDPESATANKNGTQIEAVTKDQLNTGLTGQIRFRVSEQNLYAYLFGVKGPFTHVMGYFVAVLRGRIANFQAKKDGDTADGPLDADSCDVSINDLRKNLRDLNEFMEKECRSAEARYGIVFDASLITGIDPPEEVDSALAAINTAHNEVSSDLSLARAAADQKLVESKRAVEIETLKAEAEVEPLRATATQLAELKKTGAAALRLYLRNVRLALFKRARTAVVEAQR